MHSSTPLIALLIALAVLAVAPCRTDATDYTEIVVAQRKSAPWRIGDSVCVNRETRVSCGRVVRAGSGEVVVRLELEGKGIDVLPSDGDETPPAKRRALKPKPTPRKTVARRREAPAPKLAAPAPPPPREPTTVSPAPAPRIETTQAAVPQIKPRSLVPPAGEAYWTHVQAGTLMIYQPVNGPTLNLELGWAPVWRLSDRLLARLYVSAASARNGTGSLFPIFGATATAGLSLTKTLALTLGGGAQLWPGNGNSFGVMETMLLVNLDELLDRRSETSPLLPAQIVLGAGRLLASGSTYQFRLQAVFALGSR